MSSVKLMVQRIDPALRCKWSEARGRYIVINARGRIVGRSRIAGTVSGDVQLAMDAWRDAWEALEAARLDMAGRLGLLPKKRRAG